MSLTPEIHRELIVRTQITPTDSALRLFANDEFSCHYAPFDHINANAKVVLGEESRLVHNRRATRLTPTGTRSRAVRRPLPPWPKRTRPPVSLGPCA